MTNREKISNIPLDKCFSVIKGELSIYDSNDSKDFKFDVCYLDMAKRWGINSHSKRKQVGALIVKNKMIISDGYNGQPAGFDNVCELEDGTTHPWVLHAESNAIAKVAKSSNNCEGSTVYINLSPCLNCTKLMIQSGISRIVFSELYRDLSPLDLLEKANIDYHYIPL